MKFRTRHKAAEVVALHLAELMQKNPKLGTQAKLAKKTGVGQTTIGRIRRGEVDATVGVLNAIAEAFGVTVGYLCNVRPGDLAPNESTGYFEIREPGSPRFNHPELKELEETELKYEQYQMQEHRNKLAHGLQPEGTGMLVIEYLDESKKVEVLNRLMQLEEPERRNHRRIADFELVSADDTDGEVGRIEYWDARGSCGGGFLNHEQMPKGHLVKEATFFHKYNVKPDDVFAIYADGDSMSDFIVDGDIVIFNKKRTTPRSGKIYALEHPDGMRIKVLRRNIDGTWNIESRNPDKRIYPDERITAEQLEGLTIHGEFVYRQGG